MRKLAARAGYVRLPYTAGNLQIQAIGMLVVAPKLSDCPLPVLKLGRYRLRFREDQREDGNRMGAWLSGQGEYGKKYRLPFENTLHPQLRNTLRGHYDARPLELRAKPFVEDFLAVAELLAREGRTEKTQTGEK